MPTHRRIAWPILFATTFAFVVSASSAIAGFSSTAAMTSGRRLHTATLLPNGKVLIAGGSNSVGYLNTAELYDPVTGTFSATSSLMTSARRGHTATLLPNGKVLIAGGDGGGIANLNTAELYNPAADTFESIKATMTSARARHTATLMQNGRLLIAGGVDGSSAASKTTEVYDPATRTFTRSGSMLFSRSDDTATLLPDGMVLVSGGSDGTSNLDTAELYDPQSGTFTGETNTPMTSVRFEHTATLLPTGKVLIAGGYDATSSVLNTAELYDPATRTFTPSKSGVMNSAREAHTATLLPNGQLLIAGGVNQSVSVNTAELYSSGGTFTATSTAMSSVRFEHTATLLSDGTVLIAGGLDASFTATSSAEIYDPAVPTLTPAGATMMSPRASHTATLLPNGKVLIAGGDTGSGISNSAELYDKATGFTSPLTLMTSRRTGHIATLLAGGKVLIAGGNNASATVNTAELYDPATLTFTATAVPMISARYHHTATLLRNGKVLITGGDNPAVLSSAELYDPASGSFTATSMPMTTARTRHTATLLADGRVLITGGFDGSLQLNSAELYDPDHDTFTATATLMDAFRQSHTATLLRSGRVMVFGGLGQGTSGISLYDPNANTFMTIFGGSHAGGVRLTATLLPDGKVLLAGGTTGNVVDASTTIYDPATDSSTASGLMTAGRERHTATLLPDGKVLLAGGFNGSVIVSSADVYDSGLGLSDARRPVIDSLTNPLCQPASLTFTGSAFAGDSEGSSGTTESSAANAAILRLQRVDNDQLQFLLPLSFSASSFESVPLSNLASGRYRAVIASNAVPSIEKSIQVETTPLLATYGSASVSLYSSMDVAPASLPAGYNGAFYPQTATVSNGFTGTLTVNGSTGALMFTNAGPIGDYTITLTSSNGCGSQTTTVPVAVVGPPSSLTPTAGTPQSTELSTTFGVPLQATVHDSAGHPLNNIAVTFTAPASGPSAMFTGNGSASTNASGIASMTATANSVLGTYGVTVAVGALTAAFTLTNTPAVPTNVIATAITPTSVSVTWRGTPGATYEVLRLAAAGGLSTIGSSVSGSLLDTTASAGAAYLYKVRAILPTATAYGAADLATTVMFTDPTLGRGTVVRTAHVTELRTAVDAVRALAGMTGGVYTDPTLTAGLTVIRAVQLTDLRSAIDAARQSLALPFIAYAVPTKGAGITAADMNDLRNRVQ